MVNVEDPVGQGVIASLAHPGGNVTGLTHLQTELVGKRVELLKEAAPTTSRLGVVNDGKGGGGRTDIATAANTLGIQARSVRVPDAGDIDSAIEKAIRRGVDSLLVYGYPATLSAPDRIVQAAAQHNLPAIYDRRDFVVAGGLMAYGANDAASFRRAAYYVDRILKGTKPADLPVEQPTTFDFVINLKTAQALGLAIPQHVLLQATEVVQ